MVYVCVLIMLRENICKSGICSLCIYVVNV